jgi:rod shape determining protein RodA
MFDRRLIENWDWILLLVLLLLAAISIFNLYSATYQIQEVGGSQVFVKQIYWYLIGFGVFLLMTTFNYSILHQLAYPVYFFSVALLVWVLFMGKTTAGSQRWISFGPISFQASELAKVAVVLVLAKFFSEGDRVQEYNWKDLLQPLILIGVPAFLIMKEPDLGTTLHLVVAALSMFIFVKISWKSVVVLALPALGVAPFIWFRLKSYQQTRILAFLRPDVDPLGAGYHINQSKIAIGSGGLTGKGFLKGTQSGLHFLPQQHTDFIFSVLAEEGGFVVSLVVLAVMFALLLWGVHAARKARDRSGYYLALGVVTLLFLHFSINIGMTTGILPVVGLPLPLMSYGGSSVLTTFLAIGLLMNVRMRRFVFS